MGDAFLALAIGNHVDRRVTVLQPLIDNRRNDKTCIVCDVEIDLDNALARYPARHGIPRGTVIRRRMRVKPNGMYRTVLGEYSVSTNVYYLLVHYL
jgi:hypothetical protein